MLGLVTNQEINATVVEGLDKLYELSTINVTLDPSGKRLIGKSPLDKTNFTRITGKKFFMAVKKDLVLLSEQASELNFMVNISPEDAEKIQ